MANRNRPRPSRTQRERLYQQSGGYCQRCGEAITIESFHLAHLRADVNGGALVDENLEAWCSRCNWVQGPKDVRDTRTPPREWQLAALDRVVERIMRTQVATVAAAPGAGKTILAGLVFEALHAADVIDRLVVLAPRLTLVEQWRDSLLRNRQLELKTGAGVERRGQDGVVVTYQSLSPETVGVHRRQADLARTLFVLDEVHHVGEPTKEGVRPGWAHFVTDLIGDVRDRIYAAGVLNLSGTLWRSRATERISTVRYVVEDDGRIRSDVDFEVTAAQLIKEGQLRPVDLFRMGATVELVNLSAGQRTISPIADLDEGPAARAAIRELPGDPAWRSSFVEAILDRLERRHRDLGNGPAKALIVAKSQEDARAFQETTNLQMRQRGLPQIAEVAVSDNKDAHETLKRFRDAQKVGVLCTVDMAGEGYDCPDIVVVGFASNKLTPLYVRQVVARAQRVTSYEREKIGHPIPAAVVIPDVPELVEVMSAILEPMGHEIRPVEDGGGDGSDGGRLGGGCSIGVPTYVLDGVADHMEGDARVTGEVDGDVAMSLVRLVEPEARRVGLPESDAPRMILAVRGALTVRKEARPFDPLGQAETELAEALAPGTAPAEVSVVVRPLSIEEEATALRQQLAQLGGWWHTRGNTPVAHFHREVNEASGIGPKGRESADLDQLRRAAAYARRLIGAYCDQNHLPRPRNMRPSD